MTRVVYFSRINLLSGRTNVYNLAKTCEALNNRPDFQVELVTTDQSGKVEVFFQKMGIKRPFPVTCLGVTSTTSCYQGRRWYELFTLLLANLHLLLFLFKHRKKIDIVYSRDESLFLALLGGKLIWRKSFFFETHSVLKNRFKQLMNKTVVRFASGVIAISAGLRRYYQSINKNILVSLCSAAEDSWFDYSQDKLAWRQELALPAEAFLLGYTGVVGFNPNNDCYEIDDVIRSLVFLPAVIKFVIVGELNRNAEWLRDLAQEVGVAERAIIRPWQERSIIPKYLQAFDVTLIPKRKKDLVGDSPAKMFPALAARRPIIAGRAECIEEVLTDEQDALIVKTNDPAGWTEAILKIYNDRALVEKLSNQAWITNGDYTWEKRGQTIAKFISQTIEFRNNQ